MACHLYENAPREASYPFGDALTWLNGTVPTKDVRDIKRRVNQLIETQTQQQETCAHIILILTTRYAIHINRQHINVVMKAVQRTHNDITTVFNITISIYTHINYQQILLQACSIVANLRDSLYYKRQIAVHAMDYIDTAITGILLPHMYFQ